MARQPSRAAQEQPKRRAQPKPLHERLAYLFETVINPATKKPYTLREVSARLKELGVGATGSYLQYLRDGQRDNPSVELIKGLAQVFGVPIAYFLDEEQADRIERQLAQLGAAVALQEALDDPKIPILAIRARGLSAESLDQLLGIVNRLRELEGLNRKEG